MDQILSSAILKSPSQSVDGLTTDLGETEGLLITTALADEATPTPPVPLRRLYFINELVEWLLTQYIWTGCTRVELRDRIMSHATELIRQIIRKQGLHTIYPGQDDSAFGDLIQTGWCVTPDTLLFTDRGLITIDEMVPDQSIGDCDFNVYGQHGLQKATKFIRVAAKSIVKIVTKFDYSLAMSPDHPLPILTIDGIIRKAARDLREGDLVAVQFGQNCFGNEDNIDCGPLTGWTPPTQWTEELAYLVGLLIAEGSITTGKTTIYNSEPEVIAWISEKFPELRFKHLPPLSTSTRITGFAQFLEWLGIGPGTYAETKHIPAKLLRCSKPIVTAMLRGMFDGDGHSNQFDGATGYTSISPKLIGQLRVLLLNFGIMTKTMVDERTTATFPNGIISTDKFPAYQLCMSSIDSKKFYESIGFMVSRKQNKQRFLTDAPFQYVPHIFKQAIYNMISELGLSIYAAKKATKSQLTRCRKGMTREVFLRFAQLATGDGKWCKFVRDRAAELEAFGCGVRWVPIDNIGIHEGQETVDIEVPTSGTFTANGITSYNCQLERILYKYRARPHCRKCFNPDRPSDSALYEPGPHEYGIKTMAEVIEMHNGFCPKCKTILAIQPMVEPVQGRYGGSASILYRGSSKVFNLWSQVSRTVILAYIKKEGRDRKNSGSYVGHLGNKRKPISDVMGRFLEEIREICKYNDDHQAILKALEWLIYNDERPHEGIITKLVDQSGLSRVVVTNFMRLLKLRSFEFTDSPLNHRLEPRYDRRNANNEFEEE